MTPSAARVVDALNRASEVSPAATSVEPISTRLPFRQLLLAFAAALALFTIWALSIPPLEGPDESYFYQESVRFASGQGLEGSSMMPRLASPILRAFGEAPPLTTRSNPSFRFISNEHGRVNRYLQGPARWLRSAHQRRLLALRALNASLYAAAIAAIFWTAYLFFGRSDLAWLTAALCASVPQFSFMAAVFHTEATSTLGGAVLVLVLMASATGAIGVSATLALVLPVAVALPFTDRQGFPFLPFLPVALVVLIRPRRLRAAAMVALVVGSIAAYWWLPGYLSERVPALNPWFYALRHPWLRFGNQPNLAQYYVGENFPKLFEGFWGWLGQPSILLPPLAYALTGSLSFLALASLVAGLVFGKLRNEMWRPILVLALAIAFVTIAIVAAPVVLGVNLYYGRWFFPVIGPIMIVAVATYARMGRLLVTNPRAVVGTFALVAIVLAGAALSVPGDWVRTAILGHHYGDQARLLLAVDEGAILTVLFAVVLVVLAATDRARELVLQLSIQQVSRAVAVVAVTANLLLLFGFVRPLYASMSADEFHRAIARETDEQEYNRATELAAAAVEQYPDSSVLRNDHDAARFRTGPYEQLTDYFHRRLTEGPDLNSFGDLMSAARMVRITSWPDASEVRRALAHLEGREDLAGPAALLRAEIERSTSEPDIVGHVLDGPSSTAVGVDALYPRVVPGPGAARVGLEYVPFLFIEGFDARRASDGHCQLALYFRPRVPVTTARLWLRAYSPQIPEYVDFGPNPAPYPGWRTGELAWEFFQLPFDDVTLYVGSTAGPDQAPLRPVGRLKFCAPVR